jgi:uncharacterized Zn finger protein (UPF0148 family)
MSLDIQNRVRGACLSCGECPAYLCVTGRVLCDYCGCPPARHQLQQQADKEEEEEQDHEEEEEGEEEAEG